MTPAERIRYWRDLDGYETRFIKIMRKLHAGQDPEQIAALYNAAPADIEVYRKALNGELTVMDNHYEIVHDPVMTKDRRDARKDKIRELLAYGLSTQRICQMVGCSDSVVKEVRRQIRAEGGG